MIFIILLALLEGAICSLILVVIAKKQNKEIVAYSKLLESVSSERRATFEKLELFKQHLVPVKDLRIKVDATIEQSYIIQAERGRTAITQAESESIEGRLKELEEIERELEASEEEGRQELEVFKTREGELRDRNDDLKNQINSSLQIIEKLKGELNLSSELQRVFSTLQDDLIQTQDQIDELIDQISKGNDQGFQLKRRYDALDIEYAQLYEKFIGE
jgi:chromosome segregation ATPase